jgi:DNA-binding IclR family transcriptional regulator
MKISVARDPGMKTRQVGVNSLEVGLRLARALAEHPLPQALKDLAASAGMPPAKAHRYLVSLMRAGLAEQDSESSRYRLGPMALELGMSALNGLDVLKFGGETIAELRATIDETVLLAIWGNKGPVVMRWLESSQPVATNVRAGWVMPLLSSATGRLFAAFLPPGATAPLLKAELARNPGERATYAARLDKIREQRISLVEGDLLRGVAAVAAPVFGLDGTMVAAITALGLQGSIDISRGGAIVTAVQQSAQHLSKRLGHSDAASTPPAEKRRATAKAR